MIVIMIRPHPAVPGKCELNIDINPTRHAVDINLMNLPLKLLIERDGLPEKLPGEYLPAIMPDTNICLNERRGILVRILCENEDRQPISGLKSGRSIGNELRLTLSEKAEEERKAVVRFCVQEDGKKPHEIKRVRQ